MIEHKTYQNGEVQSLGFTLPNGKKAAVCVAEPGAYNLGIAPRDEMILVLSGYFVVHGVGFGPESDNAAFGFKRGDAIEFEVEAGNQGVYLRSFG